MKYRWINIWNSFLVFLAISCVQAQIQPPDSLQLKGEADSLKSVADSLYKIEEFDLAMEAYAAAIEKYAQIGDADNRAKALLKIGNIYLLKELPQKAAPKYQESVELFHQNGNYQAEINASYNLARAYRLMFDYPLALQFHQRSLELARKIGDETDVCDNLNSMGVIYQELSEFDKAMDCLQEGYLLSQKLGNLEFEYKALNNLGILYDNAGDLTRALDCYQRSLEIVREWGDKQGESIALQNIGVVYANLFDYPRALEYFQRSLELSEELDDTQGITHALTNIGAVYFHLMDFEKSLDVHQQSLELARQQGNQMIEAAELSNMGGIYLELGEYVKANNYLDQCLKLCRKNGYQHIESYAVNDLGRIYLEEGKSEEAIQSFQKAVAISEALNIQNEQRQYYLNLGDCYSRIGNDSPAVVNYKKSVDVTEKIRGSLKVESQKSCYTAGSIQSYEKLVLALLRVKRREEAFNYVERGKARAFLDMLASGNVHVGKSKHEEFLRREEQVRKIERGMPGSTGETDQSNQLRNLLEEKAIEQPAILEEKKKYEPELVSLVAVNSLSLPEVQELLDPQSSVLEYFITTEKIVIWLITKSELKVYPVDVSGDSVKKMVEEFRDAIVHLGESAVLSRELYDVLIQPVQKDIRTEKLIFVPHGILHYLPFQALQNAEKEYLLDKYTISYLPSASTLKYLEQKKRQKGNRLLALGNPTTNRSGFPPLPLAEQEVMAIRDLMPESRILIGDEATERKFNELAPQYDILHIACHGELDGAYPLFSGLILAPDEDYDGDLDVHEIFTLDLHAYLVVLSACQTGLGHLTNGDELVGLSRAFIYAGTPSILSSLWMVDDESTSYLMAQFYRHLEKTGKGEALRLAQMETRKKYTHPHSWAAFVLIGDGE